MVGSDSAVFYEVSCIYTWQIKTQKCMLTHTLILPNINKSLPISERDIERNNSQAFTESLKGQIINL